MTRYLMRVDSFEVDVLEVNTSALPQIGSLLINKFFLSHSCNTNKKIKYRQSFVFKLLYYFYLFLDPLFLRKRLEHNSIPPL